MTVHEKKWTAGEWSVRSGWGLNALEIYPIDENPDGFSEPSEIASVNDVYDEYPANAHLIAASPALESALEGLLTRYLELVDCGDCGNWEPRNEPEVIASFAALASARGEGE